METLNKLLSLLTLQNNLNVKQHCAEWAVLPINKRNNCRAAYHELTEVYDHIGWGEWWKPEVNVTEENKFQAKLELVDAFHFLLSEQISNNVSTAEFLNLSDIVVCAEDAQLDSSSVKPDLFVINNADKFVEMYNQNLDVILGNAARFILEDLEEANRVADDNLPDSYESLSLTLDALVASVITEYSVPWEDFFLVCRAFGMDFESLYTLYLCKNALNHLRSSNGYKRGEYIKNNWGAKLESSFLPQEGYAEEFVDRSFTSYLYDKVNDLKGLNEDNSLMPLILEYLRETESTFELQDVLRLYEEAYARVKSVS